MNNQEARQRIEQELTEIEAVYHQVQRFIQEREIVQSEIAKEALVEAIALSLHGFYTGAERIFQRVARSLDYSEPTGENWHR